MLSSFFTTEVVIVITTTATYDDLGEVAETTTTEESVDVLVRPATTADLAVERPNGERISYVLAFPKTWSGSLCDSYIVVRGEKCKVVGDPSPLTEANCPTPFNMTVEVERVNG